MNWTGLKHRCSICVFSGDSDHLPLCGVLRQQAEGWFCLGAELKVSQRHFYNMFTHLEHIYAHLLFSKCSQNKRQQVFMSYVQ